MMGLSEYSPQLTDSASLRDLLRSTEAAKLAGCRVHYLPQELPEGVSADDALWHVPPPPGPVPAPTVWIGYIPLPEHYEAIYEAALRGNLRLVNSPEECRRAEEFDRFYPWIGDLTAESLWAEDEEGCVAAAQRLGYPVFLKGAVQSLKGIGVNACVAHDEPQLRGIVAKILSDRRRSLGTVIVRRYMELRAPRIGPGGLPLGREYRVFLYRDQVLGLGYYWEGADDLATLTPPEREKVARLAMEASRRLRVPYLAVDVGQLVNGEWKVIEVGDAQFSGLCQVSIHALWAGLQRLEPGPVAFGSSGTGG